MSTTYLNNVQWRTGFSTQRVLVAPTIGETWLPIRTLFHVCHISSPGNVVFHQDCESRATHCSCDHAAKKLLGQVHWVIVLVNAAHKEAAQVNGCLEDGPSLFDGDAISHVPWELLERADQAFVWPLGTFFRERRLHFQLAMILLLRTRETYPMRNFDMLDKHCHFFLRNKPLEVLPGLLRLVWLNFWTTAIPNHTVCNGE